MVIKIKKAGHSLLKGFSAVLFLLLYSSLPAFAAHPLVTDDTGTQGRGNVQLEFIGEYGIEEEDGVRSKGYEAPTAPFLSYGLTNAIDIVFSLPYSAVRTENAGVAGAVRGVTDASIELKARFYEKNGFSMAVKPGVILPAGDENKGLGNGRTSYSAFLIATMDAEPWAFHFNLGSLRNEYRLQADQDGNHANIWHISAASQREVAKDLNIAVNIGMERNYDKTSSLDPAFALIGLIYAVTENLDIDLGLKTGLNRPETDTTVLAGITWRL